jgi:hypothetical protein
MYLLLHASSSLAKQGSSTPAAAAWWLMAAGAAAGMQLTRNATFKVLSKGQPTFQVMSVLPGYDFLVVLL